MRTGCLWPPQVLQGWSLGACPGLIARDSTQREGAGRGTGNTKPIPVEQILSNRQLWEPRAGSREPRGCRLPLGLQDSRTQGCKLQQGQELTNWEQVTSLNICFPLDFFKIVPLQHYCARYFVSTFGSFILRFVLDAYLCQALNRTKSLPRGVLFLPRSQQTPASTFQGSAHGVV